MTTEHAYETWTRIAHVADDRTVTTLSDSHGTTDDVEQRVDQARHDAQLAADLYGGVVEWTVSHRTRGELLPPLRPWSSWTGSARPGDRDRAPFTVPAFDGTTAPVAAVVAELRRRDTYDYEHGAPGVGDPDDVRTL